MTAIQHITIPRLQQRPFLVHAFASADRHGSSQVDELPSAAIGASGHEKAASTLDDFVLHDMFATGPYPA